METRLRTTTKLPLPTAEDPLAWALGLPLARARIRTCCSSSPNTTYILAEEFMPSELPLMEKARAPAFVLLHAQLLNSLDSTIHRQEALQSWALMESADAVALPLPGNNLLKEMDENRMIVLLKDMLADSLVGPTISEAFVAVTESRREEGVRLRPKAPAASCWTFRAASTLKVDVDLRFWLEAFKPILAESQNTLSEIS